MTNSYMHNKIWSYSTSQFLTSNLPGPLQPAPPTNIMSSVFVINNSLSAASDAVYVRECRTIH